MKVSTRQGKYFRGGKVQKSFLLGFCIFAFVLFRVFWYRTFYIINEVEFTVWKTYKGCYINSSLKFEIMAKQLYVASQRVL